MPIFIEHVYFDEDAMLRVAAITRQNFGRQPAPYRDWWAANKDGVKLEPEERWW